MKKILLLGGSEQQIIAIQMAKQMGLYTILLDYLTDNPGQYYTDKFYLISTTDKEKVFEVAKKENINGILAYASDPAAPTAAYVAEKLQLSGNPYYSVENLCNKDKFRNFLKENNFSVPVSNSFTWKNKDEIFKIDIRYPAIIKPVDSSGSKGVTVIYSEADLSKAVMEAFSYSRSKKIIIEDFVEKKHPYLVGGDIFVINGEIVLYGLLNCYRDDNVNNLVPIGKSYPLLLQENDIKKVKNTLQRIVTLLEIENGAMNVELIINKRNEVIPIDIGPRCGGNMIPEFLGDIFGINLVKVSIQAAMGMQIDFETHKSKGFYATYNIHSKIEGKYKGVVISDELESYIYRKHFYKKVGDKVEYFDNASKCLGILFLKFPDLSTMNKVLDRINSLVKIELL